MDLEQRDKLSELVEELTTSGQQQLNQEKIKEIKKICRYVCVSKENLLHIMTKKLLMCVFIFLFLCWCPSQIPRSRLSNDYVDHVYDSVMAQLDKEHAEIRLSAFQIASELFSRSHQFRIRLVDNFQVPKFF